MTRIIRREPIKKQKSRGWFSLIPSRQDRHVQVPSDATVVVTNGGGASSASDEHRRVTVSRGQDVLLKAIQTVCGHWLGCRVTGVEQPGHGESITEDDHLRPGNEALTNQVGATGGCHAAETTVTIRYAVTPELSLLILVVPTLAAVNVGVKMLGVVKTFLSNPCRR